MSNDFLGAEAEGAAETRRSFSEIRDIAYDLREVEARLVAHVSYLEAENDRLRSAYARLEAAYDRLLRQAQTLENALTRYGSDGVT